MSEIALKRDNERLGREIAELKQRIAKLEAIIPKKHEQPKQPVTPEKPKHDAGSPCRQVKIRNGTTSWEPGNAEAG